MVYDSRWDTDAAAKKRRDSRNATTKKVARKAAIGIGVVAAAAVVGYITDKLILEKLPWFRVDEPSIEAPDQRDSLESSVMKLVLPFEGNHDLAYQIVKDSKNPVYSIANMPRL